MRSPRQRLLLPAVSVAVAVLWGCGSSKEDALLPVSGTVTVEGKPLTTGWLTFYPDAERGNTRALLPLAEIKKDGTYEVSTNSKPGAPPGWYKVVVAASQDPLPLRPPPPPWKPRWLMHEKYAKPETTDSRIEVVENPPPGSYDLKLAR